MFERFTDEARRVVVLAQEEARLLGHNWIGTEHLVVGVISAGGTIADALAPFGLTLERTREEVQARTPPAGEPADHIPFTDEAKKAIELALRESSKLGHHRIGPGHLLLGVMRVEECLGAQIIADVSDDVDEVTRWLREASGVQPAPTHEPVERAEARLIERSVGMIIPERSPLARRCAFCDRDLWEVEASVAGRGTWICADCVQAAADALRKAAETGASTHEPLQLPPRVFGPAPDEGVVAGVTKALRLACGGPQPIEEKAAAIEDGDVLAPLIVETGQRFAHRRVDLVIGGMRFLGADHAQVRFEIVVDEMGRFPFEGEVVRRDGHWRVTRETIVAMLRGAGVNPPPPEP